MLNKLPKLNFNLKAVLTGVGTLCVGLLLGWTLRGALLSPVNMATSVRFDDWRTECASRETQPGGCEMFQLIVDANTRNPVARMAYAQPEGKLTLAVTLPFEVLLEGGLGLAFGQDPVKVYQFKTCNLSGCIVMIPVDDKLATAMRSNDKGKLMYAGMDGKPVAFEFSMKGFEGARQALVSGDAKRRSLWWRLWS